MMRGEGGDTAQACAAVQRAASGEGVEEAVEGVEEAVEVLRAGTRRRKLAEAIYDFRVKLLAFFCRPHWSEADKQLAFGFTLKCAHVYFGTLSLGRMDPQFQRSYTNMMMDYLNLRKPLGNTPSGGTERGWGGGRQRGSWDGCR